VPPTTTAHQVQDIEDCLGKSMQRVMVCGVDVSKGIAAMTYTVTDDQATVRIAFTSKDPGTPSVGGSNMKDLMKSALDDYLKVSVRVRVQCVRNRCVRSVRGAQCTMGQLRAYYRGTGGRRRCA
jgi:hypothetical protein